MKRTLSSESTFFYKGIWLVSLLLLIFLQVSLKIMFEWPFLFGAGLIIAAFYFFTRPLMDVQIDETHIYFSDGRYDCVKLFISEIKAVNASRLLFFGQPLISIEFKLNTKFGNKISFIPSYSNLAFPFWSLSHPMIDELRKIAGLKES